MTIALNGSDLTVTQVVMAARHGEKVCSRPRRFLPCGVTGVRPELAQMIVTLLNEGFAPPVRTLGSIGQGDLGPMADLAHGLLTRSGYQVAENEGLALVSSNAFTTAWACIAAADADALLSVFDVAGALDLEAFGANLTCLHPVIEQTRPFPGLAETLHRLRLLLAGSYLWQPAAQAIDLRAPGQLGLGTGRAYRMIRELVPFTPADGTLPADLEPVVDLVTQGGLTAAA